MNIHDVLNKHFTLQAFRPGQEAIINTLLHGNSALAVFPTGGGKSLCYQLPALMLDGLTLVVSPLIALMKDQVDHLRSLNIPAARLDSSLSAEELAQLYEDLYHKRIKLLYVAPERLSNERFLKRLSYSKISLLAVDEAHCVSEWGHNFRPDYLKLARQAKALKVERILALTATATPEVSKQICESFNIDPKHHIQTGFYRANLHLSVTAAKPHQREQQLLQRIQQTATGASIVYVTLQKTAEHLAQFLSDHGLKAVAYHAGLKDDERNLRQEQFKLGHVDIVVATIAFGMGIDKADIRAVYHYNLPKSLENYMQEIGRAGRDGQSAHCELLALADDLTILENFTYGDTPDSEALRDLIEHILQQADTFDISVYELSNAFDVRPLVVNTLFTYLELYDILAATSPFYSEYKIAASVNIEQLIQSFDPQRQLFLRRLFNTAKKGRTWLTIKPEECAQELKEDKQRIIKALNYLDEKDLIQLRVAGVRQGYRMLSRPTDSQALIQHIETLFQERESRDIKRMENICQWIESRQCHQQALVSYFGEELSQPCGQCSACRQEAIVLPQRQQHVIDEGLIEALRKEKLPALHQARQLTRFLCGISSPKASRAKLSKHSQFASLHHTPFKTVLAACKSLINR